MRTVDTREIRRRAADLLTERGWNPEGLDLDSGPLNADGAIYLASGEDPNGSPSIDGPYLQTVEELEAILERNSLFYWEREDGRTVDQVLHLLRFG